MMPNFIKKFSIILLLLLALTPATVFADAESIFKENSKAVVVIVTFDSKGEAIGQGSGFIVRADGVIVTNYHVISNASDIKVKAGDKILDVEGLIYTDKQNDLVILKAIGLNLPTVKLGDIEKETIGETLYVISSPQGLENTISDGILSGIRDITSENKVLQITAPISPGSSGSPVFNKNGEVIGIVTFLLKESQNLNFAMPVNLITDKINIKKTTVLKDAAIDDYTKTAEYWFYLGIEYNESGRYLEAIDAYKKVIKINPNYETPYYNLGIAYYKLERYQEALEAFKKAVELNPNYVEAYFFLGLTYEGLSYSILNPLDIDLTNFDAINAYMQSCTKKPECWGRHLDYLQKQIDAFKEAIKIKPDYVNAHYKLAWAYVTSGSHQKAIDEYKQVIWINPDDARAHFHLGAIYDLLGNKGMALEEYNILKNLDKAKANSLFNLIYE